MSMSEEQIESLPFDSITREAVLAERERCAKIAENFEEALKPYQSDESARLGAGCRLIAAAIRSVK